MEPQKNKHIFPLQDLSPEIGFVYREPSTNHSKNYAEFYTVTNHRMGFAGNPNDQYANYIDFPRDKLEGSCSWRNSETIRLHLDRLRHDERDLFIALTMSVPKEQSLCNLAEQPLSLGYQACYIIPEGLSGNCLVFVHFYKDNNHQWQCEMLTETKNYSNATFLYEFFTEYRAKCR